jgi:NCAIR mutase (PurE)-related protein
MDREQLNNWAARLQQGLLGIDEFVRWVEQAAAAARPTIADVGVAQVDLDRARRCGFPEVVFGPGKPPDALLRICTALLDAGNEVFATRIDAEQAQAVCGRFPQARYNPVARTLRIPPCGQTGSGGDPSGSAGLPTDDSARWPQHRQEHPDPERPGPPAQHERADGHEQQPAEHDRPDRHGLPAAPPRGRIAIVTAGTSDRPVAEEARETAQWMGLDVTMIYDIGVAGPQRLLAQLPRLRQADAVVVVAGMEGALPSVVGGYVSCPVVGVPTSVGYGAQWGGIAALLSMLNSCAANVTVVNIDAGFKGAYVAGLIARAAAAARAAQGSAP